MGTRGAGGAAEEGAGSERHGGGWSGACQREAGSETEAAGRQGKKIWWLAGRPDSWSLLAPARPVYTLNTTEWSSDQ